LLRDNIKVLEEKIKIMSFLELIFELPKNKRIVDFKAVADVAKLNIAEVEYLLMRVLNLELIKGEIDQIEGKLYIDWIIPRFMNKERIVSLSRKFEDWNKDVDQTLKRVEDECE